MVNYIKYRIIKSRLRKRKIKSWKLDEIESKQVSEVPFFNDSSYFNGIDNSGQFFLSRMSFRTGRNNEHWLEFYSKEHGLLRKKDSPGVEGEGFSQGAFSFEMLEPGQSWKIRFDGTMINDSGSSKNVSFDLIYEATTPLIDFQHAMMIEQTSRMISEQKWSKIFFAKLEEMKKMHFEQGGKLKGTISVEGKSTTYEFSSMRDHSWGKRIWGDWKRHVWICGMLDNGDCINVSMISYDFLGQLSAGYYVKNGQVTYLKSCPKMESFASAPLFPDTGELELIFGQEEKVILSWNRINFVPYDMDNGEYKIFEGISRVKVGKLKGNFVTEFGLNPVYYDVESI